MRVWCKCVWRCGCGEEVGAGVVTVDFVVPRRACARARASDVRGETHSRVFVHTPTHMPIRTRTRTSVRAVHERVSVSTCI